MTNATATATATPVFAPEALQTMVDAAASFIAADLDVGLALHRFMRAVGGEPTYSQWEAARGAYIQAYLAKSPKANEDAQNKSWSRFVAKLRGYADENGFEFAVPQKPKAETPAAQAMAAKRAEAKAAFDGKTPAELETMKAEAVARVAAQPTKENIASLSAVTTAHSKAVEAETKAAKKVETDATKKRRDVVAGYVKTCPPAVLHLFELLADATADNVAPDVQSLAVKQLIAAMKPAKAAKPAAKK